MRKGLLLAAIAIMSNRGLAQSPENIRFILDPAPSSLNPRTTLDGSGQRIGALLYRGLTRLDRNLQPTPDLADRWRISRDGKTWIFDLKPSQVDHDGNPITASDVAACLENYRVGKPASPLRGAFSSWIGTEASSSQVRILLREPDPYLARNLFLLRFFRIGGKKSPCTSPEYGDRMIGSGPLRVQNWKDAWNFSPDQSITLIGGQAPIEFDFLEDDNTKVLKLMRGEIEGSMNSLALTKTQWVRTHLSNYHLIEREGVNVSYLAFNMRNPILAKKGVRQAIALAIPREQIIEKKLLGFCTAAGSFLSPLLPESKNSVFPFDPKKAETLLDQAGFQKKDGVRFLLHYKTTPSREGQENALMFQDALGKVGIEVQIDVVEPAVFLSSIRKGAFDLYASRWLGIADGSILRRTLHSKSFDNRAGYSDVEMDRLLDESAKTLDEKKRTALLQQVQTKMSEDLPYFPLWYWNNTLILKNGITGVEASDLSLSGALEPLIQLR